MTRRDTRYLKQRANGLWLVQVAVPRALRKKLRKDVIEKSLRTDDYLVAVRRRDKVLPLIRQAFERAKIGRLSVRDFNLVNLLIEGDVRPQRISFDDALALANAGEKVAAREMLDKLVRQRRNEPDEFVSENGKVEFYRDGQRVMQDAAGRWRKAGK